MHWNVQQANRGGDVPEPEVDGEDFEVRVSGSFPLLLPSSSARMLPVRGQHLVLFSFSSLFLLFFSSWWCCRQHCWDLCKGVFAFTDCVLRRMNWIFTIYLSSIEAKPSPTSLKCKSEKAIPKELLWSSKLFLPERNGSLLYLDGDFLPACFVLVERAYKKLATYATVIWSRSWFTL